MMSYFWSIPISFTKYTSVKWCEYHHQKEWWGWKQHLLRSLSNASVFLLILKDPSKAKLWREWMLLGFSKSLLATTSPSSLHNPSKRAIEFSFPFIEPNLRRSIRSGINALLFLILSNPSEQPRSEASTTSASFVMSALSSINNSTSTTTTSVLTS